jgi:hypothetical protein
MFPTISEMIGKMKAWHIHGRVEALALGAVLICCLVALSGCPPSPVKPPPPVSPSFVITEGGVGFYVRSLRIPGTRQELRLKEGGTLTWVPLEQVSAVVFDGPIHDTYRHATIALTGGEKLRGEVFVNFLIEGTTDLGYWNMPMSKVESLYLAYE